MSALALAVTIAFSLTAAACFAAAVVLQQRVTAREGVRLGLLVQPMWMLGILVDFLGFGLQVTALHLGPLTLVQPLLVTTLLFGLAFNRSRLRRQDWLGVAALAVGVTGFLAAAAPGGGGHVNTRSLAVASLATAALICAALIRNRPRTLASVAAVAFGMTAALVKVAGDQLTAHGPRYVLVHWELYALGGVSFAGLVLQQRSYEHGRLVVLLVILTLGDPLASLVLGLAVDGEHIQGGVMAGAAVLSGAVVVAGVVALARSPAALSTHRPPDPELGGGDREVSPAAPAEVVPPPPPPPPPPPGRPGGEATLAPAPTAEGDGSRAGPPR